MEIWLRNSRALGYSHWGSDLDLTLWCRRDSEILKYSRWHQKVRKVCPLIGEAAFITERNLPFILKYQNPLELRRDPVLCKKANVTGQTPTLAQKAVYFARMLNADFNDLNTRPKKRQRKWNFHLSELQLPESASPISLNSLAGLLASQLGLYTEQLEAAFQARRTNSPDLSLAALLVFTPRWLDQARASGMIRPLKDLPDFTEAQQKIIWEQVRWELANLSMQPFSESIMAHTRACALLLERTAIQKRNELIQEFAAIWNLDAEALLSPLFARDVSATFCIAPWKQLFFAPEGSYRLCEHSNISFKQLNWNTCDLSFPYQYPELQFIRRSMQKGEPLQCCRGCHELEQKGLESPRIAANRNYDEITNRGLPLFEPEEVFLNLGKACDHQCLSCNPAQSSRWQEFVTREFITKDARPHELDWYKKAPFTKTAPQFLTRANRIYFARCSPLQDSSHAHLLEKIIKTGKASGLELIYISTPDFSYDLWKPLWRRFKNVELRIEFEAVGARNEYLRFPSRWKIFEENLKKLDSELKTQAHTRLTLQIQLYSLNAYYLSECLSWIEEQNFKTINAGQVYHPGLLITHHPMTIGLPAIPSALKTVISQRWHAAPDIPGSLCKWLPQTVIEQLTHEMMTSHSDSAPLRTLLNKIDQARPHNFADAFQEIASYWK